MHEIMKSLHCRDGLGCARAPMVFLGGVAGGVHSYERGNPVLPGYRGTSLVRNTHPPTITIGLGMGSRVLRGGGCF